MFDPSFKKVEIVFLYQSILRLGDKDFVTLNKNLKPQLLAESTKIRMFTFSQAITKKLKDTAANLK